MALVPILDIPYWNSFQPVGKAKGTTSTANEKINGGKPKRNSKGKLMELPPWLVAKRFSSDYQPDHSKRRKRASFVAGLFSECHTDAVNAVIGVLMSPHSRASDVLRAAEIIFEYSIGKAPQAIALALKDFEDGMNADDAPARNSLDHMMQSMTPEDRKIWALSVMTAFKEVRGSIPAEFRQLTPPEEEDDGSSNGNGNGTH